MSFARQGTNRWYSTIVRAVFDAATDPALAAADVADQRAGALERARFALGDLAHARAETAAVQTRMVAVLDQLGLAQLATSIPGLSAVGAGGGGVVPVKRNRLMALLDRGCGAGRRVGGCYAGPAAVPGRICSACRRKWEGGAT